MWQLPSCTCIMGVYMPSVFLRTCSSSFLHQQAGAEVPPSHRPSAQCSEKDPTRNCRTSTTCCTQGTQSKGEPRLWDVIMPRDVPLISSAEQDIMFTCGVWGTVPDLLTLHLLKYIVAWTKHCVQGVAKTLYVNNAQCCSISLGIHMYAHRHSMPTLASIQMS